MTISISFTSDSDSAVGDRFAIGDITYEITKEGVVNEVRVVDTESSITSYVGTSAVLNGGVQYSVTSIGDYAFYWCTGLTSVTIPDSVTSIGDRAFYGCTGLTSVTIPDSVTSIGNYAFENCTSLKIVNNRSFLGITKGSTNYGMVALHADVVNGSVVSSTVGSFKVTYNTLSKIYRIDDYLGSDSVLDLSDLIIGGDNYTLKVIGREAFRDCTGLTSVTIPDSVISIGDYAFSGCTSISSISLGIGVTTIESYAFSDCSNLRSIFVDGDGPIISHCSAYHGCDNELEFVSGKEYFSLTLYIDSDHNVELSMDDILSKDCTIYLKWDVKKYTITFDTDGGSAIDPITLDYDSDVVVPASPTRTGYTFVGWSPSIPDRMPAENITCVAQWSGNEYSVSFNANGGSTTIISMIVTYGDAYEHLPVPSKIGYEFIGWYTSASFDTLIDDETIVSIDADHMLHAKWSVIWCSLDFTVNGISMDGYPKSVTYGSKVEVPITAPSVDPVGDIIYVFSGWEGFTEGMVIEKDMSFAAIFIQISVTCPDTVDGSIEFKFEELNGFTIPSTIVDEVKDRLNSDPSISLDIILDKGAISLDSVSVQSLNGGESISITGVKNSELPPDIRAVVGTSPVYEISVGDIHDFREGTLTIMLDYTLKEGESADGLEIWHFSSGGQPIKESCTYDPIEHRVVFITDSLSKFAIMHIVSDVGDDDDGSEGAGGSGMPLPVGIGAGVVATILVIGGLFLFLKRRS